MASESIFWVIGIASLLIIGIYTLVSARNFVRALIALEVITKGVTLILVLAGYLTQRTAATQAMVITLIVMEAVMIAVAAGIIISIQRNNDSLSITKLLNQHGEGR